MISLSFQNQSSATSQQVEIAFPFWFGYEGRKQAQALIEIGFSYQGENEDFLVESSPIQSLGNWVFYSVGGFLEAWFEDARWSSNVPAYNLNQVITVIQGANDHE